MTDHDPIEVLLKATGRRPAVASDRTDRVREAVSARLRQEVARRRRRVQTAWGVAAAAVVVTALGLGALVLRPSTTLEASGVHVERMTGAAWAKSSSIFSGRTQLEVGSDIPRESTVTTGDDARVALRSPTGHSVRLDTGTTVVVRSGGELALTRGAVYVDSHREGDAARTPIRIETPLGTIEDQGTQFAARLANGALSLRVREGTVSLRTRAEQLVARAGETVEVAPSGRVERTHDAGDDVAWAWAGAIAPMMEIEGRSLRDFLEWVVRERGVRLRFDDAGLADRAPSIVLRGSIDGMTLEEATASVLETSGLDHRWETGELVVSRRPDTSPRP